MLENIEYVIKALNAMIEHRELYKEYLPFESLLKVSQQLMASVKDR
jgi:hypothetical protein